MILSLSPRRSVLTQCLGLQPVTTTYWTMLLVEVMVDVMVKMRGPSETTTLDCGSGLCPLSSSRADGKAASILFDHQRLPAPIHHLATTLTSSSSPRQNAAESSRRTEKGRLSGASRRWTIVDPIPGRPLARPRMGGRCPSSSQQQQQQPSNDDAGRR